MGGDVWGGDFSMKKSRLAAFFPLVLASMALGQTFEVDGQNQQTNSSTQQAPNLGWGSGIEVARQARAAEDALKHNDYNAAVSWAEQAAKAAPQDAELWFLLGYCARLASRYQVSVDAYHRGLQRQPNSVRGLAGLAQSYTKMGREAEARQTLLRVIEADPKDADSLGLAGELFLPTDTQRALDLLQRAEAQRPTAHLELMIARAYTLLNQPDEAKKFLNRAKARGPHDPDVLRAVAEEYRQAGQYSEAIATLQAVPAKTPDVLAELAYTYELNGDKQQAADTYAKAAKEAKGNVGLLLSTAQALVGLGHLDAAREFLAKAQGLNGNHYRLHAILAQIAVADDQIPDAIHEYQLALERLPSVAPEGPLYPVELRLNLYELQQQLGNQAEAKKQLEMASAQLAQVQVPSAGRPEFLRLRAVVEAQSGDLNAADKDLKEALALSPRNANLLSNFATLQWKFGQKEAARDTFKKVLELDPKNRSAQTSLGFLARDMGDTKLAEQYFLRVAKEFPKDAASHLALGDLYGSEREFDKAESSYEAAYKRNPTNPLIIAGGVNAALEAHELDRAKAWVDRASGAVKENPQVMRETQRYLTWKAQYQEAADLGFKVLAKLPRDRQAPVYLAYDLYYLQRYQEALDLALKYEPILPDNRDLALIEGYVHARNGLNGEALEDFSKALQRDPKMATGYVNRGFVLNNLKRPKESVKDFQTAVKLQPDYGEAHLGLAFAYLQLQRPRAAVPELDSAKKYLGESRTWHLARAEAFRQEQDFGKAEKEYQIALKENADDFGTQMALAEVLYRLHRYHDAIAVYQLALKLSPNDPGIFASLAQAHAKLGEKDQAMRYIESAEKNGKGQASIFMTTGDALLTLGDREAAMRRFSRALETDNHIGVRLAIAETFVRDGKWDEARRQVVLGLTEVKVGDAPPLKAEDLVQIASIFLAIHEFDLAESYFEKAQQAGANERSVAVGLANTFLAEGKTGEAEAALAPLGKSGEYTEDYDYMMAVANMYRQRQDTVHALTAFAKADTLTRDDNRDDGTLRAQYELAEEEGRQINQNLSLYSAASFAPQLEDINVYTLDAKLSRGTAGSLLPPPRHSFQSLGEAHYKVHLNNFPAISGFVGESMTSGRISLPSLNTIEDRHTYDTIFNGGVSPIVHLGPSTLTFNGGLQFTIRRDSISPRDMNQDLFRQFVYLSTTSLFNWVAVRGAITRETGPFTETHLRSRELSGNLEFTVGRPWGNTSLIAGYSARDLLFNPVRREYYSTATYVGLQHNFGKRLTAAVLGEYLRSWQVDGTDFAIAQAMLPGARVEYRPSPRWNVQGSFVLSRGEGFHSYDNAQSEFLISYVRPVRRNLTGSDGGIEDVAYPTRFSFGLQQQTFYNFAGQTKTTVLPVVRLTLF